MLYRETIAVYGESHETQITLCEQKAFFLRKSKWGLICSNTVLSKS